MSSDTQLLQFVSTFGSPSCFTCRLNCGQEKSDKHTDDGNHDQKLNEGKSTLLPV
jgi:hypothetical protein